MASGIPRKSAPAKPGIGALQGWTWGGWLIGIIAASLLAIPSYRSARASDGWTREFAGANLVIAGVIGGTCGGFLGGVMAVARRSGKAAWRYAGISLLAVAAFAVILIGTLSIAPSLASLLLAAFILGSPVLWAAIAARSLRREW